VEGVDLWRDPIAARRRIGFAPEEPAFYEELSADEYLAFVAGVRGLEPAGARARAGELCARLGLAGRTDEPVRRYSHGMRKKLSFIAALLHRPAALLCDEALEGFDAAASLAAREELLGLAASGSAILFSSHVTETLERLCRRAVILHRGRVAREVPCRGPDAPDAGLSALEREFLAIAGSPEPGVRR
jgi:ABC-2 type transport system ATP-binding protein